MRFTVCESKSRPPQPGFLPRNKPRTQVRDEPQCQSHASLLFKHGESLRVVDSGIAGPGNLHDCGGLRRPASKPWATHARGERNTILRLPTSDHGSVTRLS